MRILLLANNIVGLETCRYLVENNEEIVGLVVHPPGIEKYRDDIIHTSGLSQNLIFEGDQLHSEETLTTMKELGADIAIQAFWGIIVKPSFIDLFPQGVINFHPAYLPYNRGKNPNVWPIVEGSPGGVTIHYVDEGIDTGDIIARRQIPVELTDTGGSYYQKTLDQMVDLFKEIWPQVKSGDELRIPQEEELATFHLGKQVDELDEIDLDKMYTGRELINQLRSRTYEGRKFCYFKEGDKKIYMGLSLSESPN